MIILYLLLTFLLLGVLIVLHEGGHYAVARLCGIKVNEFAVGMGPKVLSFTSKKTGIVYSFRAFPIGGFVSMEGEDGEAEDENAFYKKPVWKRLLTVLAGPVMNLIVGFVGMFILVLATPTLASNTVAGFQDIALSPAAGLSVGDQIIAVDGVPVHTANEVVYEIMNSGFEPISLKVKREGKKITLNNVMFPSFEEDGTRFGNYDMIFAAEQKSVLNVAKHSLWRSLSCVKMIWDSLVGIITQRFGVSSVSGPIGISQTVGEAAAMGWDNLLYLFVIISVNLGVMNLIPFPALDGWRIFTLLFEAVFRRPLNRNVEGYINFIGFALLMVLMVLITGKDIKNVFFKGQ